MKIYGLYDLKHYEECVCIGTIKDISIFLQCTTGSIRSHISHRKNGKRSGLLRQRYELVEIIEEDIKERPVKNSKEAFQLLVEICQEEKFKFEIFDEFKWMIKGMADQVMLEEEWKKIPQFDYSISSYGRIRNEKNGKIKSARFHRWIIQTDIYKDGKRYTIDVPRMEASLFIRPLKPNERVTYIDGDKRNNYYKNLKIVCK